MYVPVCKRVFLCKMQIYKRENIYSLNIALNSSNFFKKRDLIENLIEIHTQVVWMCGVGENG